MDEFFRFIQKSERERIRLIREARAIYDSVFPPAAPVGEQSDRAPIGHTTGGVKLCRGDGVLS
jgi:hypothetical protein